MSRYASLFKNFLTKKGIRYDETDEGAIIIGFNAENTVHSTMFVDFERNEKNEASIVVFGLGKCSRNQYEKTLIKCNSLNQKYRWFSLFVTNDNDIIMSSDIVLDEESFCEECYEYIRTSLNMINEVYPLFDDIR